MRRIEIFAVILLVVLFFFMPRFARGEAILELVDRHEAYELFSYLTFLEDAEHKLSIAEVSEPANQERFLSRKGHKAYFGASHSVFWARLKIVNHSPYNRWFVILNNSGMRSVDRIEFYWPQPYGGFEKFTDGENVPPEKRMLPSLSFPGFGFYIAPGQSKTCYFRIQDQGLLYLPMVLKNQKKTQAFVKNRAIWLSVFGAFGFFLVYNLLLFITLKDKVFLFFTLMLSSCLWIFFVPQLMSRFTPELDIWIINLIKEFSSFFFFATWLLLTRNYFQLQARAKGLDHWIKSLFGLGAAVCLAMIILPYNYAVLIAGVTSLLLSLSILAISAIAWKNGFAAGRFYIVAIVFVFFPSSIRAMNNLGVLNVTYLDQMDNILFFLIMLLFSCLALIDRHNILNKQMLVAQKTAEKTKDEFLANTSHELRTPLHGIIGLCEDLVTRGKNLAQETWEQELGIVIHSARRLSSLVDDIMDFTRIRQGSVALQMQPVDFSSALNLSVTLCKPLIGKKEVQIRTDIPDELPQVLADENRLQQVLINLIKNAIRFTISGEIIITAKKDGQWLKTMVQDTGTGIPESNQEQVFERFFQADGTIEREHDGLGLGLAITRQLVELHGGKIAASNHENGGAVIEFTLKFAQNSSLAQLPETDVPEDASSLKTDVLKPVIVPEFSTIQSLESEFRILVVDDDPISLHTLYNHLSTAGFAAYCAQDADAARKLMKTQVFDLVVLDIMMPRVNGYEFCREIREAFNPAELPVVMLTARTQTKDLVKGFECGANDYLTKPVNREELLSRIQISLKLKSLNDLLKENVGLKEEIFRRKRAEQSLENVNRQLAAMLNLWESALMLVDGQNRVLYVNECAEMLFGYSGHEVVNHCLDLIFPNPDEYRYEIDKTIALQEGQGNVSGQSCYRQLVAHRRDGKTLDMAVIVTPIILNDETLFTWIFHDQSETGKEIVLQQETTLVVSSLAHHRQKIQALQGAFDSALKYLDREGSQIRDELELIDRSMVESLRDMPEKEREKYYREKMVALMNTCLAAWTEATGLDKVALAEKSGIWRTYLDVSTFKTRTLDKYLNQDKLPKNPRWKDVLKTADFVVSACGEEHNALMPLHTILAEFKAILSARQLV